MSEFPDKLPQHVAVMMDGNGRWAGRRGLSRNEGHRAGADSVQAVVECCLEAGIPFLTLFAFSTENWRRPRSEVNFLMRHLRRFLKKERVWMLEHGVRLLPIGALEDLSAAVRRDLRAAAESTQNCRRLALALAVNYGSRREIVDAARAVAREVKSGAIEPEDIDEELFAQYLYTAGLPDPDLIIRTAGELRLSNFLLYQASYAELYVTDTLWPDFRREGFIAALRDYARRHRRFGALDEPAADASELRTTRQLEE